jgi:peroxiredoxin
MRKFNSFVFSLVLMLAVTVSSFASDGLSVGDQVSDFSITNYDGNTYTLSTSGGSATVVVFMSTECPFVQPYTDRLNALVSDFSSQGIVIWGINSNSTESTEDVQAHAAGKGYTFPMLKDNESTVAVQFGAERTPEVYVIDNKTMTVVYHGRIDDDKEASKVTSQDLKNALTQFLNGETITVAETKAFGCTIKK